MTDLYWNDDYLVGDDGSESSSYGENTLEVSLRARPGGSLDHREMVLHSRSTGTALTTPKIPADYEDMFINGSIAIQTDKVMQVLQILHNDPRIWREVVIGWDETPTEDGKSKSSPAFLAVLASLMTKTKRLHILGGLPDRAAYCSLMAGLMMPDSVQELVYEFLHRPMSESNAKLLAHGMANSTCLQELRIQAYRTEQGVGAALIDGLRNNKCLKKVELNVHRFDSEHTMANLVHALQDHPALESLTIQHHEVASETMERLGQYLYHPNCKLQELKIVYGRNRLPPFPAFGGETPADETSAPSRLRQNKTLQHLQLHHTRISSQYLYNVCQTFTELRHLSVAFNSVSDLSSMASFLCSENCKIEHLSLVFNLIKGNDMRVFAPKIPYMKSLRRLLLDRNYILGQGKGLKEEAALLQMILDNVKKSRTLECFSFDYRPHGATAVSHALNVNRGGRRGILQDDESSISMALWPHILHRALSIKYFSGIHRPAIVPNDEKPRASVIFSLLKDHPCIFDGAATTMVNE